jgi:hypothetical protein
MFLNLLLLKVLNMAFLVPDLDQLTHEENLEEARASFAVVLLGFPLPLLLSLACISTYYTKSGKAKRKLRKLQWLVKRRSRGDQKRDGAK